ncbi:MAG: carboxypeptidase-like regulatory domain-containing protein, partial [Crocinitomicaceae bacterium]
MLTCHFVGAQDVLVSGTIYSSTDSTAIPDVKVKILGTNSGTLSDWDGNFTIKASPNDTLELS